MADQTHRFQPPKGTRDFYPHDMAVRRYIESVWREVSINHGFEEIDGPTFEHLELYTTKSGEEIVSQLFSFRRAGGDTDYALRPEFTPTLARMYAAKASSLPQPTRWFCMPSFFRAERPQRGRLREFFQWNIDVLGDDSPRADAEVIACVIDVLKAFGLPSKDITIKISHRDVVSNALSAAGVAATNATTAMSLLDRRGKLKDAEFAEKCAEINLDLNVFDQQADAVGGAVNSAILALEQGKSWSDVSIDKRADGLFALIRWLHEFDVLKWCEVDVSIVRGLAYYTGTVFEVHETTGKERAIAGGGRYDGLVELFGGPPTPAVGIAMGDVMLRLMLEDHNLLPDQSGIAKRIGTTPDVFVVTDGNEDRDSQKWPLVYLLRSEGFHVRCSDRDGKKLNKQMKDAARCSPILIITLDEQLQSNAVRVRLGADPSSERNLQLDGLSDYLRQQLRDAKSAAINSQ